MRIMVSACLMGENCKYNGGNNLNEGVVSFVNGHEVFMVCPEVMGGLSVPRVPSEICMGKVINKEGTVVDEEFRKGAQEALEIALKEEIDLAVLKARSPSCGAKMIYDGSFTGTLIEGKGVFADILSRAGFRIIDEEDIENES